MFTGIVEELGKIAQVDTREGATGLTVSCGRVLGGTQLGDSIAVNGVCLTVTELGAGNFSCEAVPETLRRSNLGGLEVGSAVNLERALPAGRPMGGHYVQGHVDGTVQVAAVVREGEAVNLTFQDVGGRLIRYLVPKAYVALDGASLTVVQVDDPRREFLVTLIPHTQKAITLGQATVGARINMEIDILAKYVDRLAR